VQSNGIALALHGEAQHGASQLIGLLPTDLTGRCAPLLFGYKSVLIQSRNKISLHFAPYSVPRISRPVGISRRLTKMIIRH
jgi:hypothetical protein